MRSSFFSKLITQALLSYSFLIIALAQNPQGPLRPEIPSKVPEIEIENTKGIEVKDNPDQLDQQIIIYTGEVRLTHRPQQMIIQCERLEFFTAPPADDEDEQDDQQEGNLQVEKIIAIGQVVIIKTDDEGNLKIGRSGRAVYDPNTGTAVLTIAPQIQDDTTLLRAKDKRGVITMRETGTHEARDGNFQTLIRQAN